MQLLGSTAHTEEASECYTAVWEQLAILARSTMYDPANLRMSGAYWPLTTACFLVRILRSSRHLCGSHQWLPCSSHQWLFKVHQPEPLICAICSYGYRSPAMGGLATAARTRVTAGSSVRCRGVETVSCVFVLVPSAHSDAKKSSRRY